MIMAKNIKHEDDKLAGSVGEGISPLSAGNPLAGVALKARSSCTIECTVEAAAAEGETCFDDGVRVGDVVDIPAESDVDKAIDDNRAARAALSEFGLANKQYGIAVAALVASGSAPGSSQRSLLSAAMYAADARLNSANRASRAASMAADISAVVVFQTRCRGHD